DVWGGEGQSVDEGVSVAHRSYALRIHPRESRGHREQVRERDVSFIARAPLCEVLTDRRAEARDFPLVEQHADEQSGDRFRARHGHCGRVESWRVPLLHDLAATNDHARVRTALLT